MTAQGEPHAVPPHVLDVSPPVAQFPAGWWQMSAAERRLYVQFHLAELAGSVPLRPGLFPFWFLLASHSRDRQLSRCRRRALRAWEEQLNALSPPQAAAGRMLLERWLTAQGYAVIGIDEAGRGALAGPLLAAAVLLPAERRPAHLMQLDDSKRLDDGSRRRIYRELAAAGTRQAVGRASPQEIDEIGIQPATHRAMARAVQKLLARCPLPAAPYLLVDGFPLAGSRHPQCSLVKGERLSLSIAAASVVAKVVRDRCMERLAPAYAPYGLAQHKGYGTEDHRRALSRHGPTPLHRRSFLGGEDRGT